VAKSGAVSGGGYTVADRIVFNDSVTPLPADPGVTPRGLQVNLAKPSSGDEQMTLLFSLAMPHEAQEDLEAKVASGQTVSIDDLNAKYSPTADTAKNLMTWLRNEGFDIVKQSPGGSGIYARASVDQIEKSLGVDMIQVTKDGVTYTAARDAPSLPADVGEGVQAIVGLQPFRQAHKHRSARLVQNANRGALINGAPSPNIANTPPYLVSEILAAYGATGLNVTGKGQTIAILIDTFPNNDDLTAFWTANGLPNNLNRIQKINVQGGALPPPQGEETLDVEWSSGIARDATIRIYATGSLSFVDIDLALDRIFQDLASQPGLRQLSMSLGLGETYFGGPKGEVATQHQKFLKFAAAGVNVFVSTGDAGSNPDATGHSAGGLTQVEYEASDTAVVAVGGTSLSLAPDGTVDDETAWPGGGGGISRYFPRQPWQVGDGVPAGAWRLVPDVSLVADPNTGAFVVLQGSPVQYGGTSWSAPVWAGFCALINEARLSAGKPALPFLNPIIYPLQKSGCFRDIEQGSNGSYSAGPWYDLVTGLGTPNVTQLIGHLA
jgi:kumamolisin